MADPKADLNLSEGPGSAEAGEKLQEQLLRQKTYFENLFKDAPEGIIIADKEGRILRANGEFCRIFGFKSDEIIGQNLDSLIVPAEAVDSAISITRRVTDGEKVSFESVRHR
jgi:PAS domain S-box-containing protein